MNAYLNDDIPSSKSETAGFQVTSKLELVAWIIFLRPHPNTGSH